MADIAHTKTDQKLEEMEKRLSAIYSRAEKEIQKTADEYFSKFAKQDEAKRKLLEQGKITEDEYTKWRKGKVMYGKRFTEMKEQCAKQLLNVNQTALAYVNGELPEVYAMNYNALESAVDGVGGYSFTLVDADTVRNLAVTDTSLLPYKELDPAKDIPWNMKKINAETLQGILQGESMDKIAKRIMNVQEMNKTQAIRSARTIVTGAECKGRQDSYKRAKNDGIILRKYWLATYDKRARDWHKEAGNDYTEEKAIDIDDFFIVDGEKMLHPGDAMHGASGHNLYNCRCSIASKVVGFKKAQVQKAMAEKQEEFVPAKTQKEAEQYAKRFADEVSYNGISVENCNEINRTLDDLQRKYPSKKYSKIVGERQNAIASANYGTLSINGSKIGSKEAIEKSEAVRKWDQYMLESLKAKYPRKMPPDVAKKVEKLEQNLRFDRFSISHTYGTRAAIAHEYAHTLSDQYFGMINGVVANQNAKSEECLGIIRKIDETRKKAWETGDIFSVSKYAATDDDEFFAEVFAMREMGEKIPDYFDEMLEEALKNGIM